MNWPWKRKQGRWAQHPCSPPLTVPDHLSVVEGDQWLCHCNRRWVVTEVKHYVYPMPVGKAGYLKLFWQEDGYHVEGTEKAEVDKTIAAMEENWNADS